MKERSGKDSNVEFQSGATKKPKPPVVKPKPRPKSVGKVYTNPPRKPAMTEQKKAQNYTGKVYNPEPKAPKPKKNLPLSGKDKRGTRSRLNPFIDYGDKKKTKPPLKFKSPAGNEGGSDALYRVPQLSGNKKKKIKT